VSRTCFAIATENVAFMLLKLHMRCRLIRY